jgi:nucleoside-diphosphate-sugar epimerase
MCGATGAIQKIEAKRNAREDKQVQASEVRVDQESQPAASNVAVVAAAAGFALLYLFQALMQLAQKAGTKVDRPRQASDSDGPKPKYPPVASISVVAATAGVMLLFPISAITPVASAVAIACIVGIVVGIGMEYLLRVWMGSSYLNACTAFRRHGPDFFGPRHAPERLCEPLDSLRDWGLWKIPVMSLHGKKSEKRSVLLTGGSGFVGSMLMHDLALHCEELNIDHIIVVCRTKRGESAQKRIEALVGGRLFENIDVSMIETMEGDVSQPSAGLSDSDLVRLGNLNISHVFHCAAAVSFTQSLPDAARSNISASLHVQALTRQISSGKARFVHLSTAFVHGGRTGSELDPLREQLFDLGKFDPMRLYQAMMDNDSYASGAMTELQFPNTYTFSKSVCEHLLLQGRSDTIIIRPSIVGPALIYPYEGWAGSRPSTLVAATCLYFYFQWNLWCFGNHRVPCIPVDILSRYVLLVQFFFRYEQSTHKSSCCRNFKGLSSRKVSVL